MSVWSDDECLSVRSHQLVELCKMQFTQNATVKLAAFSYNRLENVQLLDMRYFVTTTVHHQASRCFDHPLISYRAFRAMVSCDFDL